MNTSEDEKKRTRAVKVQMETGNGNEEGIEDKLGSEKEYGAGSREKNKDGKENSNDGGEMEKEDDGNNYKEEKEEDSASDEYEAGSEDKNKYGNEDKNENGNEDTNEFGNKDKNDDKNKDENEDKNDNGNNEKNDDGNEDTKEDGNNEGGKTDKSKDGNNDEYENKDEKADKVRELRLDVSQSQIVGRNNTNKETDDGGGQAGVSGSMTVGGREESDPGGDVAVGGVLGKSRLVKRRRRREVKLDPKVSDHRSDGLPMRNFSPSESRKEALQFYNPSYLKETLQPFKETTGLRATLELYNPLALRKSLQPYDPPQQDINKPYKKMSSIYSSWKSGTNPQNQVLIWLLPVLFSLSYFFTLSAL